jgi:hypothetical protein
MPPHVAAVAANGRGGILEMGGGFDTLNGLCEPFSKSLPNIGENCISAATEHGEIVNSQLKGVW